MVVFLGLGKWCRINIPASSKRIGIPPCHISITAYSLADIVGFLNYPPQSQFAQIFKKYEDAALQQCRDNPLGVAR